MKCCNKCHVEIMGNLEFCPLCQHELQQINQTIEELYPKQIERHSNSHLLLKIFGFIALCVSIICVFFNIVLPSKTMWSILVVGIMACVWLSIATAIKKHKNILKYLWYQMVIISILAIFIDYMTGNNGWAISVVVPIILMAMIIIMYLLSKILRLQAGDYMIYLISNALFGLIPFIFILTGQTFTDIPSFMCILMSIIAVVALVIFEGKKMKSELKRRLHV